MKGNGLKTSAFKSTWRTDKNLIGWYDFYIEIWTFLKSKLKFVATNFFQINNKKESKTCQTFCGFYKYLKRKSFVFLGKKSSFLKL